MKATKIQWTDATWNIAVGCSKVDGDCKYCYMFRGSLNDTRYDPRVVRKTKTVFDFPLKFKMEKSGCWNGRPLIFTSSLTDVFHPDCDSFRNEMWEIIRKCPQFVFQILTKRPERIMDHLPKDWGWGWENVWLGTSIGSQSSEQRVIDITKSAARVRFLSIEPLYSSVDLDYIIANVVHPDNEGYGVEALKLIDWVIIGGESGNENGKYRYRACKLEWIESIIQACKSAGVPVFVKQLGTHLSKELGLKDRHGGNMEEWPEEIRVREFPWDMEWRVEGPPLPAEFLKFIGKNR